MNTIIINNKEYPAIVQTRPSDTSWGGRESKAITMEVTYEEAMTLFHNDLLWMLGSTYEDENGETVRTVTDMSIYALAGPVTDNRDGTVTAKMGKYRNEELMETVLGGVPASHAGALEIRAVMETAAQSLDDAAALVVKAMYPAWEDLVSSGYVAEAAGFKFRYGGLLYKTVSRNTSFVAHWIPGEGTESLYTAIDESHAGTLDDPIPYGGNMALVSGLHYSQDGVVYLCIRDTGNPVFNALKDLVGIYVEVAA